MSNQRKEPNRLQGLRLLVRWRDDLYKFCLLKFSLRDASIYVFPYAPTGRFYFRQASLNVGESSKNLAFIEDTMQETTPKISIHSSGEIHVFPKTHHAIKLSIPPLTELRGHHILSICPDSLFSLPRFEGELRTQGSEIDFVSVLDDRSENARLLFFANGKSPSFESTTDGVILTLNRPDLSSPLYILAKYKYHEPIVEGQPLGTTLITGWDPTCNPDQECNFFCIRCE